MTKIKFIHTADLHLDTPFKGLSEWNRELAARLKDATFSSFRRIVDLCLEERVDFLVIAGDIFDSENSSLAAQLKFISELKRLYEKGITTYFICGNHDPLSSWLDVLAIPEKVIRFGSSEVECMTYKKDNKSVADIYGISFQNGVEKKNLAKKYRLNPHPAPFSVAVLHGTVGSPGPHAKYAPFKVEDVLDSGFDYWALGHIHKRQQVRSAAPAIAYPGNPQGRDFGETGAKGCYIVELESAKDPQIKFIPTQAIRFEELTIDLTGVDQIDALPDRIEAAIRDIADYDESASYILRIILRGRTAIHALLNQPDEVAQLREHFNEDQLSQAAFTWIDRIEIDTQPEIELEQIKPRNDFPAEVVKTVEEYESKAGKLDELIEAASRDLIHSRAWRELAELSESDKLEILSRAKWKMLDQLLTE